MGSTFTRRQFVMGAMVLGGSLALTGCSPKPESKKQDGASGATEPVQADIIVIGSGLAGSACSISAAQNGASVLLVDKVSHVHLPHLEGQRVHCPGSRE